MLNTVLVDDEYNSLHRLKNIVEKENELNIIGLYQKPNKLLKDIKRDKLKIDLIFLDIKMPGIQGLFLAEKLLNIDESIDIVFVTAYDEYAVEAFELNALDYLLKPVSQERFQKTLKRLYKETAPSREQNENLKIFTLGEFKMFSGEGRELIPEWSTSKAEELFLFLLKNNGEYVSRDRIVEELWPESPADKARNILYTTIYNIRKIFKDYGYAKFIVSKRNYYKINIEKIDYDVNKFEVLINDFAGKKEDIDNFIKKINLIYRGNFLAGKSYTWAYGYRIKLKKEYKNILHEIINIFIEENNYIEAQKLLKKSIEYFPRDEKLHKQLIEIYLEKGNELAAKQQYEELKKILQREFGFYPSFELD